MEREIIEMTMIIESLILSVFFSIFLAMLNMNNNEIERKNLHIRHPPRHRKKTSYIIIIIIIWIKIVWWRHWLEVKIKSYKIHFVCLHQIPKIILSHIIFNSFKCVAIDDYKSLLRRLNHFDLVECINEYLHYRGFFIKSLR